MIEEDIEVEANSLEEARELVRSQVPAGFQVISEDIILDGEPQTVEMSGDTSAAAVAALVSELPYNVEIIEVDLANPGSKGFLGIGRKPAVFAITYETQVRISTKIGKLDPDDIVLLVDQIKNIWKTKETQQASAEKLVRWGGEMAIQPLLRLLKDDEILVREIAITALTQMSTELPIAATKKLDQAAEKLENDLDLIHQQIDPLVELLRSLPSYDYVQMETTKPYERIREIGETLDQIGGHSAMWIPFDHIKSEDRTLASRLDSSWHLIGTWMR